MIAKILKYLLFITLIVAVLLPTINAQTVSSLSFHGVGITIELKFAEEAHPEENLYHNITITSQVPLTINNFTLTIYGKVNQTLQQITNLGLISIPIDIYNYTLSNRINFTIPQETFGRLYCTLYTKTNQDTDYFFTSFYTTHVHTITFSELLIDYNQLLINYNNNLEALASLNTRYDNLFSQKSNLELLYNSQLEKYNTLKSDFDSLNTNITSIQENFDSLEQNYTILNRTNTLLETEISNLQQIIAEKEEDILVKENSINIDRNLMVVFIIILVSLIGLIIYLRNKQKEPYVVIRKETVSVKPTKK